MKRQDTVQAFRKRLDDVIERSGLSRAAFAKRLGIDRSTLAQILSPANNRLPRAETLAAIAADQQVSIDWLLGLSQEGALSAAIIDQPFEIAPGGHSPADERLTRWHAEAAGYKVRYVPSTLPDLLKTEELIRYEYRDYRGPVPESRIEASTARLENQRRPETDLEVCCPLAERRELRARRGHLAGFSAGGAPAAARMDDPAWWKNSIRPCAGSCSMARSSTPCR